MEGEKKNLPGNLMVFDPDNLPFEKLHTCIYLSQIREESERKEPGSHQEEGNVLVPCLPSSC